MTRMRSLARRWLAKLLRFRADERGNTAVLAALIIPSLILSMGAALDYISATHREDRLNGIADAAALAAVTPTMMLQTDNDKTYPCSSSASDGPPYAAAYNVFISQAANVPNIGTVTPTICIVNVTTGTSIVRTATVHWTSTSSNVFSGVLGFMNMGIQGIASAKSTLSPRTNFYLMIDTSPSMEIPTTAADIAKLVTLTAGQGGCSYACHETNPTAGDVQGNPGGVDNYTLSRQNCLTLRIDEVNDAVNSLFQTAPATATINNTVYGIQVNTFDAGFRQVFPTPPAVGPVLTTSFPTGGLPSSGFTEDGGCTFTAIPNVITISPMTMYSNNNPTATTSNQDEDTLFDSALAGMSALMPNPGNGTSNLSDSPKEVLFIVSDAVPDYANTAGTRMYIPINVATDSSGVDWCTSIKNRKIRIAFLYLVYVPLDTSKTGNAWYTDNIYPNIGQVAPSAQACASPGLYFPVQVGDDITTALNALFQKVVATAYLSQ